MQSALKSNGARKNQENSRITPLKQRVEFMEGEIVWTNQESTTEKKGYQLDENESQIPVLYHSASVAATSSKNKKIAEIEDLQSQNLQLSQENDRLRYMLAFKDIAISKNSEMINLFSRENLQLQQQVRILEAQALKDKDISSYFLRGSENSKPPSARPLSGRPNDSQIFKNSMNASTSNLNRELLKSIPKFNQSMILYTQSNQSFSSHKSNLTIKVNTSQIQTKSTATATTVASALKERELSPIMQRVQSKEKKQRAKYNENQGINFTGTEIDENEILNALAPERFLIFEEYTQNPQMFFEKLSRESPALKIQFAEEVQTLISDFKTCLKYIKVMRKSIVAYSQIAEDLKPQEMISNTISELYQLIPSEKILFFLVDDYDQNLWTYSNIENQRKLVRINPTSGILKHVLRSGTIAKVQDVQYDPRFDPAIDAFLIQHTQNIICVPIKNQKQEVIAIVQIVNLFKQREYHIEEDIVVNMVVTALGSLLSSSVILEQNIINHQRMKSLMQSSLSLLQVEDMNTLSVESEFCLRSIMSSNLCSLLLVDDEDKTQFYKYNTLSKERTLFDRGWGLFGLANQRKEIICTDAPKAHHSYSELVDVDSLLPSITVPIQSESGEIYGVFQVCRLVTERGKQVSNLDLTFLDLLNQFSQLLVAKIEVINKIKTVVKLIPKQKPI